MIGTRFLSGAITRLLPPSIPFRFFAAAVFFYCLFWGTVFWQAGDIASYRGGSGPVLALVHLSTLGILTMTVMGASLQLLSVATRKAFKSFWICRLLSWIYIPGFMLLVYGMFTSWYSGMLSGAILAGLGLVIFFFLIVDNIRGVRGMAAIMIHCLAAMLCLLGLAALGIILIVDMEQGFLIDHQAVALSHFILAVFGFMTLLVMGFSYILVPMFALAPAPAENIGRWSVGCNILAIFMLLWGVNLPSFYIAPGGMVFAAVGCGLYLYGMLKVYKARMRKRLGGPFLLIRVAWFMLAVTIVWGAVGMTDYWPETGRSLFAAFAIVGWLLTFLLGILQRIIPFLSSMHSSGNGGVPMLASAMADMRLLDINVAGHLAGLFFLALGLALEWDNMIRFGAGLGFMGGLGLLWYLALIIGHLRRRLSREN